MASICKFNMELSMRQLVHMALDCYRVSGTVDSDISDSNAAMLGGMLICRQARPCSHAPLVTEGSRRRSRSLPK